MPDAAAIAARLLDAHATGACLDPHDLPVPPDQAYDVQSLLTRERLRRGEQIVGYKLGYTSEAMRRQMGIASPNLGPLTDAMLLDDGASLPPARAPKVEPEIALVIGTDVTAPLTAAQCREVVSAARLALEVVDSVWCEYRFDWAQNTADGSSAAFVVMGPELDDVDLAGVAVDLQHNGSDAGHGMGSAAMGDPYQALSWLTTALAGRTRGLRRGDVVITGGLCAAVDLRPGDEVAARAAGRTVTVRRPQS